MIDTDHLRPTLRTRLLDRFSEAGEYRVTLLLAGAGYGKSVALRHYLAQFSDTIAFIVPHNATNLADFLAAFADASETALPAFSQALGTALPSARDANDPVEALASWAAFHLRAYTGIIAIDDLHHTDIDEPGDVSRFLTHLVERTEHGPRWIFASRENGRLPTAKWTLYGTSDRPIVASDLAVTLADAKQLVETAKVSLSARDLETLIAYTDGWPLLMGFSIRAALRLGQIQLIQQDTRALTFDFIAEQLWNTLTAEEQNFLGFAAVLPDINLAAAINFGYSDARAIANRLHSKMPFVSITNDIFALHDLLREYVNTACFEGTAEQQSTFLVNAAAFLEDQGAIHQAAERYLQSRNTTQLVNFMERRFEALVAPNNLFKCDILLKAFEQEAIENRPDVALAIEIVVADRRDAIETILRHAKVLLGRNPAWRFRFMAIRAVYRHASSSLDYGHVHVIIDSALADEPPTPIALRLKAWRAQLRIITGNADAAFSDIADVKSHLSQVSSDQIGAILGSLGLCYYHLREYATAADYASQSFREGEAAGDRATCLFSSLSEASYAEYIFDQERLNGALERALEVGQQLGNWGLLRIALVMRAHSAALNGHLSIAKQALTQAEELPQHSRAGTSQNELVARLLVRLLSQEAKQPSQAATIAHAEEAYLSAIQVASEGRDPILYLERAHGLPRFDPITKGLRGDQAIAMPIEYFEIVALLNARRWRRSAKLLRTVPDSHIALRPLRKALECATSGPPFAGLAEAIEVGRQTPFIGLLIELIDRSAQTALLDSEAVKLRQFTKAELAVINLLYAGKSYQEIADDRNVSLSTVKAQTTSVYRKLGTPGNRVLALRMAESLGLLI